MTQYQVTLNEQTLQQVFSGDSQHAQLLECILNQVKHKRLHPVVKANRTDH